MANQKRDYYEVLQVSRTASDGEISKAYRRLAIKYHPDSNPDDQDAVVKFKECAEAYEVLSDAQKRSRYDQYGHAGIEGQAGGFQDVGDIFEAFGDMFGGTIFEDFFGGGRSRHRASRGADLRCDVALSLEEAAQGCTKQVRLTRHSRCGTCSGSGAAAGSQPQACNRCRGTGQIVQATGILRVQTTCPQCRGSGRIITTPCNDCDGAGVVPDAVVLEVQIPPGVDDGMRVRLSGEGQPSPNGGLAGDAYCFIQVRPHKIFKRDGHDLIVQVPLSYCQAVLGTDIEIPTLNGKQTISIPAGTQSGEIFRLRGQGMPDPRSRARGDLLVHTFVEIPKKVSGQQEELLRKLAAMDDEHVTPHRQTFLDRVLQYFRNDTNGEQSGS
ncbi:MAG TPA: molecular chaperone DnaJ [Planctomycetaceae bacterium]|nr:molecular chaperone DnaJ [Planctomycetaceae bacterium]